MKYSISTVVFVWCLSWALSKNKAAVYNQNTNQSDTEYSNVNTDSILLKYWDAISADEYILLLTKDSVSIYNANGYLKSLSKKNADEINKYVELFFLTKELPIEMSRVKNDDYLDVGDYSSLAISFYDENIIIKKEYIILGDDEYQIRYHPKFEEFILTIRSFFDD